MVNRTFFQFAFDDIVLLEIRDPEMLELLLLLLYPVPGLLEMS